MALDGLLGGDNRVAGGVRAGCVMLDGSPCYHSLCLQFAEPFHHIGPKESMLDAYIKENAVPM